MNDHNLDDLIIDTIEPKKSKAKSMLTIFALLIVVLIVAIILTSVILDDSKDNTSLIEANETEEMVSPELTLNNTTKVKKPSSEPKLNEIIEEELKKETEAKTESEVEIKTPEAEVEVEAPKPVEIKPEVKEPTVEAPAVTEEKKEEIIKPEVKDPAPVAEKPKEATKPKPSVNTDHFYIQVGAYKKTPSKQIMRTIHNKGFSSKIIVSNGTKKLLIGPYPDRASANSALVQVKDSINKSAFVVQK